MSDKRQKNQLVLAFPVEDRGEAPRAAGEGTESLAAKRKAESPAMGKRRMEEVCERENCKQALARVKANKGSAGVDGMTVQQLPEHLNQYWPAIWEQLLSGTYVPQPVKRMEIPKPDGGVRKLGRADGPQDQRTDRRQQRTEASLRAFLDTRRTRNDHNGGPRQVERPAFRLS